MFSFLKKKNTGVTVVKESLDDIITIEDDNSDNSNISSSQDSVENVARTSTGFVATESARISTQAAAQKFAKPTKYNRKILDDGAAKLNAKKKVFSSGAAVKDPYTDQELTLTKAEAKLKYGEDWTNHLAESDHKIALEKRYEQTKDNPWLTNDNVKKSSNSEDNIEVTSRKFNNAKRSRSNKDFVNDNAYQEKTGVKITKDGKTKAIQSEEAAQKALYKQDFKDSINNIIETGHNAGMAAAESAGITAATMSSIMNITAVIKGEKSADEAIVDIAVDTGKAAGTAYVMGDGLTTISHSLSSSKSKFIKALTKSNVPGKVITAVILTGDTLKKYVNGEITTQECLIDLGEKGLNFATTGYSAAVGQALIPIPIVGGAVGALVGSMLTSNYYHQLINTLQTKELEHQERLRIIAECNRASEEARKFRAELESYLISYFKEYQDCFDEALSAIHTAFDTGDANGVIAGTNQITRKLGGKVYYDNMNEFKDFLFDNSTDIL